jgi:hypothetical protein
MLTRRLAHGYGVCKDFMDRIPHFTLLPSTSGFGSYYVFDSERPSEAKSFAHHSICNVWRVT